MQGSPGGIIIEDIFAVPDYEAYFAGCADSKFGVYCKGENTQLQFTFEAVEVCNEFPLGCKVMYRAYSKDEVIEIFQQETPEFPGINLRPRKCEVTSFPLEDKVNNLPSGMYILQALPPTTRTISPCPLVSKSRELLAEVMADVVNSYGKFQPEVVSAWNEWADTIAPKSNDVTEYIAR